MSFVFEKASRREANREMDLPTFKKTLQQMFPELENLPHFDTLNRILEKIDPNEIEKTHLHILKKFIRNKKFKRFLINNCYPVAVDGTQKFTRDGQWRDIEWLERRHKTADGDERIQQYVYILEANLVFHNGLTIPLMSEFLSYGEGDPDDHKQDCELNALKRLATRLKEEFPGLPVMLLLDGLYPNGPLLKIIDNDRSATHLEYLEAKKRNLPIFMYVRDRLDAEYRIWKNNKDATDLNFVWCKDRNAKQLFSFIDDHQTIKDNHSNWYWSFRNTPDLKSRIARDLQIHIRHHEAKTFLAGKLSKFIRDNLSGIIEKRAGIHLQIEPGKELETWQKNLIGMLHALFVKQAEDVSVTWLRPTQNGVRRLILYRDKNFLKQPHYEFGENEGFAGKVWAQGKAQLSSPTFQHKWWEYREGCENSTYICAPVGDFKSSGGILAVGSDAGFNTTEFDLEIVSIFASILALSCEGEAIHADIRLVSSK